MEQMKIYDNFLGAAKQQQVFKDCHDLVYKMGETDRPDCPPIGMVSQLEFDIMGIPDLVEQKLNRPVGSLIRYYVNYYAPNENPYFHDDGDCVTCLYYPTPINDYDEGGETQFLIDNQIRGILHVPDRLIEFDGRVPHKANSFRSSYRFTIALKYKRKFGENFE
jgi:hypothetical protein